MCEEESGMQCFVTTSQSVNDFDRAILPLNMALPESFFAKTVIEVKPTNRHRLAIFQGDKLVAILELEYERRVACISVAIYEEASNHIWEKLMDVFTNDLLWKGTSINRVEIDVNPRREARDLLVL